MHGMRGLCASAMLTVLLAGGSRLWADEERLLAPRAESWIDMGQQLAAAQEISKPATTPSVPRAPTTQPGPGGYVPWRQRVGQAYPGNFWYSLGRWGKEWPETLLDDAKATVTNPVSLVSLGLAAAAGISLNGGNGDRQIDRHFREHGHQLNSFWDTVGDVGGNPGTHFAVAGAWFLTSLAAGDKDNYEKSDTLFKALALNGIVTMTVKFAANTHSPNGDRLAFPSGHTSSSFTFATVMYEEYGPLVGIPCYAFASYVGYERIDARNHNFSDVIGGALIGFAIGHAVAQNHKGRILGMQVVPLADAETGAFGVALSKRW